MAPDVIERESYRGGESPAIAAQFGDEFMKARQGGTADQRHGAKCQVPVIDCQDGSAWPG
ncbi:hypothetical protein GOARA_012_00810 [Gordonia araii NBRC 100433]|uniref:Uncharacterized protein n=1 Tax=Gordonia araii NBRC 100433 TaxID=1073574 RepID=G7GY56_9ACTN|nr:hypothetical protein GOARA_012_00810 [Gordonia araii NBRC 100433]